MEIKQKTMKLKLLLFTLFSVLTLNVFSQLFQSFDLYVINQDTCPYTLTGTYVAYGNNTQVTGNIQFSPTNTQDLYLGYLPSADSVHFVICGVMAPPCQGQNCSEGMLYPSPVGTFGPVTILLNNVIVDNDNDGYSVTVDCDDNNPWVYPGAFEECNGIDNNCDGEVEIFPIVNMYFVPDSLVSELNTIYVVCQTNGVASWAWQFGNGAISFDPYPTNYYNSDGTYTFCVGVTSVDGCISDTCMSFTIDSTGWYPGGIMSEYTLHIVPEYISNDVEVLTNNIKVWPNPIENAINIVTPDQNGFIEIYSVDGKRVYYSQYYGINSQIDVDYLNKGSYLILVRSNSGKVYTTRIVK